MSAAFLSRRRWLRYLGLGSLGAWAGAGLVAGPRVRAQQPKPHRKPARRGRIRQSIAHWCFAPYWSVEKMCQVARQLGCQSIELIPTKHWGTLKRHGLVCAIAMIDLGKYPPFVKGYNNPRYHDEVIAATRKSIDACAEAGFPNVIAFTGYSLRDVDNPRSGHLDRDEGIRNCVEGFKKIVGYAEQRGVTLCLEMLNTRDDTHPMKGHPGYQGDHTDFCIEVIRRVGSPRLKFLFDVYHVQIMDGDLVRRIHQLKDYIAHVHVAGNPGRGELGPKQEINYPAVMRALVEIGYQGYVGQEFIPTGEPLASLREAVQVCDV